MTVDEADDERAVRGLALAYALHADRREGDLLAELFEPDASLRMAWRDASTPPAVSRGRRQIAAVARHLGRFTSTFHLVVANHTVHLHGDVADGVVYCVAHHLSEVEGRSTDQVMYIRYLDRYRRTEGTWHIADRETQVEWVEERAVPR